MSWTSLGRVRKIALALPAIFLFSFFVLNVAHAGSISTSKPIYYLDSDSTFTFNHDVNGTIYFYDDHKNFILSHPDTNPQYNLDLFSDEPFLSYGTGLYYIALTNNPEVDCETSLSLCQSNINFEGSLNFLVKDTNDMLPISYGNTALLASFGNIVADSIYVILGVAVLLIGAGWAWIRFKKYISNKKI